MTRYCSRQLNSYLLFFLCFYIYKLTVVHFSGHLSGHPVSFSHVVSQGPVMLESLAALLTHDTCLTGGHVLHLHVPHRVVFQSHHLGAYRAGKPSLHLLYII